LQVKLEIEVEVRRAPTAGCASSLPLPLVLAKPCASSQPHAVQAGSQLCLCIVVVTTTQHWFSGSSNPSSPAPALTPPAALSSVVQAKLDDDGKAIELEVELEAQEGDRSEKRELQYTVPL
jgi:hypothetical protein